MIRKYAGSPASAALLGKYGVMSSLLGCQPWATPTLEDFQLLAQVGAHGLTAAVLPCCTAVVAQERLLHCAGRGVRRVASAAICSCTCSCTFLPSCCGPAPALPLPCAAPSCRKARAPAPGFPLILQPALPLPCLCSALPLQESEYAAWVLVNGYALNHATISGEPQAALTAMLLLLHLHLHCIMLFEAFGARLHAPAACWPVQDHKSATPCTPPNGLPACMPTRLQYTSWRGCPGASLP